MHVDVSMRAFVVGMFWKQNSFGLSYCKVLGLYASPGTFVRIHLARRSDLATTVVNRVVLVRIHIFAQTVDRTGG